MGYGNSGGRGSSTEAARKKALTGAIGLLAALALGSGFLLFGPEIEWTKISRSWMGGGPGAAAAVRPEDDTNRVYALAQRYAREGDVGYATALARHILFVDPQHIPARKFLAALALKQKNYDEARNWCEEVLHLQPHDASARLGLASAWAGLHQPQKARTALQVVIDDRRYAANERGAAQVALDALDGTAPPAVATPPLRHREMPPQ